MVGSAGLSICGLERGGYRRSVHHVLHALGNIRKLACTRLNWDAAASQSRKTAGNFVGIRCIAAVDWFQSFIDPVFLRQDGWALGRLGHQKRP